MANGTLTAENKTLVFKSPTILCGLNAKTLKGDKSTQYATAIMYLAPASMAGGHNLCPMAQTAGCDPSNGGGCLVNSGQAQVFTSINRARIAKTQRYLASRTDFMAELVRDIERFVKWCAKHGVKPAVRLNGTSDIQWEVAHYASRGNQRGSIFELFPEVQFYDYTKIYKRAYRDLPSNYSLTLSYSKANPGYAAAVERAVAETGANVAIVYRSKELRDGLIGVGTGFFGGREVIDGDQTDLRFTDPAGVIVGLYAKGRQAKRDTSGFVVG